jgi:acyl carrier protein
MDAYLVDLGLDSVEAISLLIDLEVASGVSFPSSMLTAETFKSGKSLEHALLTLLGN